MTTVLKTRTTEKTVTTISKEKVVFDPFNEEHRQAFRIMIMAGRQTELRFELEGFNDVPAMMLYKMAVFGAGAIDTVAKNTRESLAKRATIHSFPNPNETRVTKLNNFWVRK